MSIFQAENKRINHKLIGAYVVPEIYEYLCLYTTAKGVGKSRIIVDLMKSWLEEEQAKNPINTLLNEIIHHLKLQWKIRKSLTKDMSFQTYKEEVEDALIKKSIPIKMINIILREIER